MDYRYNIIYTDKYDLDYDKIADYYIEKFKNPDLINNLNNEIIKKERILRQFPYSFSKFESNANLKYEYRSLNVLNYKVFYTIDELNKIVYMERLLYSMIDFNNIEI